MYVAPLCSLNLQSMANRTQKTSWNHTWQTAVLLSTSATDHSGWTDKHVNENVNTKIHSTKKCGVIDVVSQSDQPPACMQHLPLASLITVKTGYKICNQKLFYKVTTHPVAPLKSFCKQNTSVNTTQTLMHAKCQTETQNVVWGLGGTTNWNTKVFKEELVSTHRLQFRFEAHAVGHWWELNCGRKQRGNLCPLSCILLPRL